MPGIQFGNQLDMNGFKVTEAGNATNPQDVVTLAQLNANAPQGFATDVGDGVATMIPVVHNFGTLDVIVCVFDKSTNQDIMVEVDRTDVNTVALVFGTAPALNSHRALVIPVP